MACTTDAIGMATDPIQLCARFDACAVTSGDAYAAPTRSERASLAPALVRMIALHDFDPSIALGCLRLVAGQIVTRHALDTSGWCDVEAHGERGWVPASFLMEYTAWQQQQPPYPQPHAAGIKAAARDDPASARSSTVRASPRASHASERALAELYVPDTPMPLLSASVRAAHALHDALEARAPSDAALRALDVAVHALIEDTKRVQRVPSRSLAAQRDALAVQLSELLGRIEAARAKPEASYADAALGLNSVMLAAAELVDRATAAPPMRRGSGDADSRHACSDGSLSQTPSLLDELSVHDTCSSVRDSAESERSARSAELSDGLERRTSDVLAVSPSQLLDVAHSAYEQVASVAAAFFGQLHTFEDLHLNFAFQRVVDVARLFVHVAGTQAEVDAALLAFDVQRAGTGQRGGQRLGAAHAAEAGGEDPAAGQVVVVVLAAGFDEGFEGALHDALATDVDPAAGGHLAVHEQAIAVQFVEVVPVGPFRYQVGVGNQHARGVGVGLEHAHRLAGLHQQGFVFVQLFEAGQDLVEALPVTRRTADTAVHHQTLRVFRHVRVQVVLDHAEGRFGDPVLAMQVAAVRGTDNTGSIKTRVVHGSLSSKNL